MSNFSIGVDLGGTNLRIAAVTMADANRTAERLFGEAKEKAARRYAAWCIPRTSEDRNLKGRIMNRILP